VLRQDRFNQVDWNLQKSRIETAVLKYNHARLTLDATGVGDPIAEDLQRAGISVEAFKFTEQSRRQLLDNLAVMLEQDKISLPDDQGLIDELSAMMFSLSESGKIKVQVPSGVTDDRIMSLALAVWGATVPIKARDENFDIYATDFS
jgi:phage FluMu gp28-like protein